MGRLIWRCIVVVVAFAIAMGVALSVFFALGLATGGETELQAALAASPEFRQILADNDVEDEFDVYRQFLIVVSGGVLFFLYVPAGAMLPGLAAAVAGELLHVRSWLYYVLAGGAAFAAVPLLAHDAMAELMLPETGHIAIFATAGFAGGLTYWLLAGRGA